MQCGFYQFLKKHWLVILVLLAIPIILPNVNTKTRISLKNFLQAL